MAKKKDNQHRISTDGRAKSLANLKPPFPKGVSGNPAGREEGSKNKSTILRETIQAMKLPDDHPLKKLAKSNIDPMYLYTAHALELMTDRELTPMVRRQNREDLFDRVYGKPERTVKHGRTPEELELAGKEVLALLYKFGEAEEAEVVEEEDGQE
jgi:hypothetical protein